MVRLKVLPRYYVKKLIDLFQFLMVRLKAIEPFSDADDDLFQFLMVRLKGYDKCHTHDNQ